MEADKKILRAELRKRALELAPAYIAASDEGIRDGLLSLPELMAARTVFAYWSVKREPDTRSLIALLRDMGKRVALPVSSPGGIMVFREYTGSLSSGGLLDIPEPETGETLVPGAGDLMLVPGLAFDAEGYRLGQGGGYYDRYLAGTQVFTVGLAREALLLERAPRMEHDMPVSCVVTESRTIRK